MKSSARGKKGPGKKMSGNRQRLRPWLIAKINSGDIPGLYWMNEQKTIFRIPWKHGGKQDWSPEHSEVFKEWAKHTGKYREGLDTPEWAKWKTRLRCAFNKAPDIVEIKERSEPDAANPFKVYMFKDHDKTAKKTANITPKKPTTQTQLIKPVPSENLLPTTVDGQQVSRSGDLPSDLVGIPSMELVKGGPDDVSLMSTGSLSSFGEVKTEAMDTNELVAVDGNTFPTNEATGAPVLPISTPSTHPSSSPLLGATPANTLPSPYYQPPSASSASSDTTFDMPSPAASDTSAASTLYQYHPQSSSPLQGDLPGIMPFPMTPVEVVSGGQESSIELADITELKTYQELPSHVNVVPGTVTLQLVAAVDGTSQAVLGFKEEVELPPQLIGNEMNIRVQYMSDIVIDELIQNESGCRLYYGSDSDIRSVTSDEQAREMLGPNEASSLHLPPCDGILVGKLAEYAQMLLPNIARGIHIECIDGDIYATRYCKCIIYYANEKNEDGLKLERRKRTKIFDFNEWFTPRYQHYVQDISGMPPSAEVCLSFGQQCHYVNHSENTLISTYVLSMKAYKMLENIVQTSPTQVDIEEMQISEADEMDHQLDLFRQVATLCG